MGSLQEELHTKVAALHQLLSSRSTYSVAGWCFSHLITDQQSKTDNRLNSPDRQIAFLLGVLISSSEPECPVDFTSEGWERAKTLLNEISSAYLQLYIPQALEREQPSDEWRRIHEVAMLAFLHFFNTGLLASVEQMKDRIAAYVTPFDDDLKSITGIASSDAVAICQSIARKLQGQLDRLQTTGEELQRQSMLDHASEEDYSTDGLPAVSAQHPWAKKSSELIEGLQRLGLVNLRDIQAEFPDTADVFWKQFSVSRGDGPPLTYPTEQSLFDVRPLIRLDDGTAFCITGNSLFFAVLTGGERCLAQSSVKDRFMRARDRSLEREVAHCASILLGKGTTIWEGVYETPDAQNEHDVIAFNDQLCIVFEAKASPPKEPFRDPEKAFKRIRDAYRSDSGIQKAFEQGNRVVQRIRKRETVSFFNHEGYEKGSILPSDSRLTLCACITRDNFGPLATNLTLLLEKAPDDAYPWAINILDLSTLSEAWAYFGWGSNELRTYLAERLTLHGKVFSEDELDFAGCFIRHGGFDSLIRRNTIVQLSIDYSDVFDDIYRHLHAGGPPVAITAKPPVIMDMRRSLTLGEPVFVSTNGVNKKVGRNERCPCGSGKKYKYCCRR